MSKRLVTSRRISAFLACCLFGFAPVSYALDQSIDDLGGLSEGEFRSFSEDMGAALSYKAVTPAEPLGLFGIDAGAEISITRLSEPALFDRVNDAGDAPDNLLLSRLHVHKGLPFDVDAGLSYAIAPGGNIKVWGGEIRYGLLEGGVAMPAVGVRGTYSRLYGTDALDLDTKGVELSVSKGFFMLTPYAGIGRIWTRSMPHSTGLEDINVTQNKIFLGINLNFMLLNATFEIDNIDGIASYNLKLGGRF
ncbi:MAG: hypothetical protein GY862_10130 [Gammaproteobacteria bacterium]|nr:hypothetical protein [Gammaproteobacteria bacterium]